MQPGVFHGIGIGPGDPELITLKAARLIRACPVIFTVISSHAEDSVSEQAVRALEPAGRIVRLVFSMTCDREERRRMVRENAERIACELNQGHDCCFATLGDTLSYSTCGHVLPVLRELVPGLRVDIVPGVTSWSALAARAGQVLVEHRESLRVIPAFTADMAGQLTLEPGSATVLLKTYRSRGALIERLRREDADVLYGENLTREGEFISRDLDEIAARDETYLSLMLVRARGREDKAER